MAAGTPIVASDLPGYAAVARPDQEAVLVEPGDAGALGEALRTVLADGMRAAQLVDRGTRRAEEFSMDNLAARYTELYGRVLAR
jgi:phosphatidylinositol alpha-mannosyltransferase